MSHAAIATEACGAPSRASPTSALRMDVCWCQVFRLQRSPCGSRRRQPHQPGRDDIDCLAAPVQDQAHAVIVCLIRGSERAALPGNIEHSFFVAVPLPSARCLVFPGWVFRTACSVVWGLLRWPLVYFGV